MATVLVTGASRGIGSELVKQYLADGAEVIACVRDTAAAPGLDGVNGNVRVVQMDTGSPESIAAAAAEVGDQALDVVINNAGYVGGAKQGIDDVDLDEWHRTLDINTIGPLLIARAFKANLAASGDGKLMNVTSQLAASTWPFGGMLVYSSTKAALSKVAQILALDWKEDPITVALVHPGWVRTDMGGPNAEISAEESASGIRALIAGMTKADSGKFYKWNGDIHPW
ncbi:MAG: SDR family oxidoreductase [Gammaproteobacteria bacterium]|nr:SDR family oxidoreductase [Gammaproteobacteria bacterium]MDE0273270.1 SDR family oxidoreductase [Gammaproteobacteria bacterium]MXW49201.1 SDR family oxidoreductase [Gammaproteobacteria bacterium]MYE51991.1 SDR family oxidoreductase [Gammaproteobacteria bacterium]MYE85280.1 SDR family oxidoreductase [Gammaproteobacteria bacterium]